MDDYKISVITGSVRVLGPDEGDWEEGQKKTVQEIRRKTSLKIEGRVTDFVPPEKHGDYFRGKFKKSVKGKNVMLVAVLDFPNEKNFIKQKFAVWKYFFKNKKFPDIYEVITDKNFKKGDLVTFELAPFLPMVDVWEIASNGV